MNGLYSNNLIIRETDDVFIPFDYEFSKTIPDDYKNKNLIIDSRYDIVLWKQIIKDGINVLVFNTTRHKVINIFQYFEDIMGIPRIYLSIRKIKKLCYMLLFLRYVFKNLHIKHTIISLIQQLDDSEFLKLDILQNLAGIGNTSSISKKKYISMKKKVMNFEYLTNDQPEQRSFIILFGSETIFINN